MGLRTAIGGPRHEGRAGNDRHDDSQINGNHRALTPGACKMKRKRTGGDGAGPGTDRAARKGPGQKKAGGCLLSPGKEYHRRKGA